MKKLGVIGGLGPQAGVYFLQLVTELTDAGKDQDHIEILFHSCPQIPDRTAFILGESNEDPAPGMAEAGRGLALAGADIIAIPCVTANYFYDRLQAEIPVPVIDTIEETAKYLTARRIKRAGIMATDGTIHAGLFQKHLEKAGIECIVPDEAHQKSVMHIIYDNVKAGKAPEKEHFVRVRDALLGAGAELILLGCTELSMLAHAGFTGPECLDVMRLLAAVSVRECGKLKSDWDL